MQGHANSEKLEHFAIFFYLHLRLSNCACTAGIVCIQIYVWDFVTKLYTVGDRQNTDPQSMDCLNGLPQWTTQMDYT